MSTYLQISRNLASFFKLLQNEENIMLTLIDRNLNSKNNNNNEIRKGEGAVMEACRIFLPTTTPPRRSEIFF